jgi:L-amino acid N-acyltransferase YncA
MPRGRPIDSRERSRCTWIRAPGGLGEDLVRELVSLGTAGSFHTLVALVTDENTASIRLAEKAGFRRTGTLEEVGFKFDRWLNVAVYQYGCSS